MEDNKMSVLDNMLGDIKQDHHRRYVNMELELLCGALYKNGRCIPTICQYLQADDFIDDQHSYIFKAIVDLYSQGIAPNLVTILEWLRDHNYGVYDPESGQKIKASDGLPQGYVTIDRIIALRDSGFTDAYTELYCQTLADAASKRKVLKNKIKSIRNIFDDKMSLNDILNTDQQMINDFSERSKIKKFESIGDFLLPDNGNDITTSKLFQYFKQFQTFANRKTGFANLDAVQIFAPSVQIIGGMPGAGKTTFCWQLLSQFAERGETCLYFSFEMSAAEMFTKTLARELFRYCTYANLPPLSSVDIRREAIWDILDNTNSQSSFGDTAKALLDGIIPAMSKKYETMKIFECKDETIDDLLRNIRSYCQNGVAPIVCIDYLQLINTADPKLTESDNLKIVMKELKRFSTTTNTTFMVISALNRESYSGGDTLKGFRGTSAIEFSCDAAYLLSIDFDPKVESLETAKRKQPRPIKLKCLKNRFGNAFEIYFDYYSAYDYFKAVDDHNAEEVSTNNTSTDEENKPLSEDEIDIPEF